MPKTERRAAVVAVAPPPPLPPLVRDPWFWIALVSVALVLVRSLGAAFGEPVADDFDHLHSALFAHDRGFFRGGGSLSFWRPLAYQAYYGALHGVMLAHPAWISALHLGLLALSAALLYDVARHHVPGPAAAFVASFPLLLEATRALVLVPVHIVDLGLVVFSIVAWRCAESGRLVASLAALLAALLCKETAVTTALVLPWLARARGAHDAGSRKLDRAGRARWIAGAWGTAAMWGATYVLVRRRLALELPHGLESRLGLHALFEPERYRWAIAGTLRALASLPMLAGSAEPFVLVAGLAIAGVAGFQLATSRDARQRLAAQRGWAVAGLAWFVLTTGTLLSVHPVWSPERVTFASLGLGAALAVVLGAANSWLLAAVVVVRLGTFALAPAAPARVTRSAPDRGAFVDFERLARLQRLMREARTTLRQQFPSLPHGARVAIVHPPFMTDYAAGDRALEVWYRDPTLRWVHWEQMSQEESVSLAGALEFQEDTTPQFRRIEPEAMRLLFAAGALDRAERWPAALDTLRRADSLQVDRQAAHFLGRVAGLEAWCLGATGRLPEADQRARESLAIAPENADGHLTLAALANGRGAWQEAIGQLDTLLAWYPGYPAAAMLKRQVLERMQAPAMPPAR